MSGAQTSTFTNQLYDPLMAGRQQAQTNALAVQQQEISSNEMEQASRAANWVLTQDDKPAAYSTALRLLKANGYAKNSPDQYPGDAAISYLARQGTPSAEQFKLGLGQQAVTGAIGALSPDGTTAPGATVPAGGGQGEFSSDKETARKQIVARESGGNPTVLNYVAQQDPGAYARGATASGKYQFVNSTWREGLQLAGLDPAQYATARDAPEAVQDKVFDAVYAKYGTKPWEKGPKDWVKDEQGNYQLATVRPPPGSPGGAPVTAAAAPPGGGVAARYPGAVQAAGPAVGTAPVAPPGAAAAPDLMGPRPLPPIGPGSPVVTPQSLANTPTPTLAPQNQVMPGQPNGPAATPPPAAPAAAQAATPPPAVAAVTPTAAPPAVPQMVAPNGQALPGPPQAPAVLSNGLTPQQWGLIQSQLKLAAAGGPGAVQQVLAQIPTLVNANRTALQQAWADTHPDLHFTQTADGILAQDPKSGRTVGFTPAAPSMQSRSTDGTGRWDGEKWVQGGPNDTPGKWVIAGDKPVTFLPSAARPAGSTWELQQADYRQDQKELPEVAQMAQNARSSQIRWQTMLNLAGQLTTGSGGATRTQLANLAETAGFPGVAHALIANSAAGDASAAQEFQKLSLAAAGAAERGDLGARGSLGAIRLYQQANPGLDLRPGANKAIIGMQLIAAQADADYHTGKLAYGNEQAASLRNGGQYLPLTNYDQQWQTQRNPQVYAAAMGALAGQPPDKWTKGLSDAEYNRALDIVSHASPSAVVNTKEGRKVMQPNAAAPTPPAGYTKVSP
jgi:hypothetical protein